MRNITKTLPRPGEFVGRIGGHLEEIRDIWSVAIRDDKVTFRVQMIHGFIQIKEQSGGKSVWKEIKK